ncbi:MAG: YgjV family protein [Clostridia bacterium]|nr:YgjV family protein [Clostridia bacterium]
MTPQLMGEICGGVAVVIGFLMFQQKKRSRILLLKLTCDVLWGLHFLLLQAYTGVALSVVAAARAILFATIGAKDGKKPLPLLFVFLALNTGGIIFAWNSMWSICSLISGWLATLAFWQTVPTRIKVLSLFVCASQLTYAIGIGSRSAVVNEIITVVSITLFFIRILLKKRIEKRSFEGATPNDRNS